MLAFILQAQAEEGLTIGKILSDIPHDAAAIFVYVLIAVFAALIWLGNRSKDDPPTSGGPGDMNTPAAAGPR